MGKRQGTDRRQRFTEKLIRIIEKIESGTLPLRVKSLAVFGSYARGALNPGDLDLMVVCHPPTEQQCQELHNRLHHGEYLTGMELLRAESNWYPKRMRAALRHPSEKVHLLLSIGSPLPLVDEAKRDLITLWTEDDRNWRPKLEAILPNPAAGQHPRRQFVDPRRVRGGRYWLERVQQALDDGTITLKRIPLDSIHPRLDTASQDLLQEWTGYRLLGVDNLKLAPYAIWWIREHRQWPEPPEHCVIASELGDYEIHLGRPFVGSALSIGMAGIRKVALLPHIRRGKSNELLEFSAGPNAR